jgi:hypothetical protein
MQAGESASRAQPGHVQRLRRSRTVDGGEMDIEILSRPTGPTADQIVSIVRDLTGEWFTPCGSSTS